MNRSLVVVVGCAVALLVAGAIVALVTARQPESTFPAGTPEAVVADYLRLLQSGDLDGAFALTSMQSGSRPLPQESFQNQNQYWSQTPHRVTLISSKTNANQATVVVEIVTFQPDIFGTGDDSSRQTFLLARQDGEWRITSPERLF